MAKEKAVISARIHELLYGMITFHIRDAAFLLIFFKVLFKFTFTREKADKKVA
jgi:hypothetical protein